MSDVAARLEDAGLPVHATTLREPEFEHETTPQAFVIARRHEPGIPYELQR